MTNVSDLDKTLIRLFQAFFRLTLTSLETLPVDQVLISPTSDAYVPFLNLLCDHFQSTSDLKTQTLLGLCLTWLLIDAQDFTLSPDYFKN